MFGCAFRSRLEARWAMVFTELGVTWEYEPRVFRTLEGGYLPDFRLLLRKPCWLEIKGPEPIERDYVRAFDVQQQTGQKLRFLVGNLPVVAEHGILRTRITAARSNIWRPADWKTPWPEAKLTVALRKAINHKFD